MHVYLPQKSAVQILSAIESAFGALHKTANAIVDGEIVCLSDDGRPQFNDLLHRHTLPWFCTFDLLWLNGEDMRGLPLHERKNCLRKFDSPFEQITVTFQQSHRTQRLRRFRAACGTDLEGIVAKLKHAPYVADDRRSTWIKIKNPHYTQAEGRHELFEQMRN